MKPYGHRRSDNFSCKFGCCTGKGDRRRIFRKTLDRYRRKAARIAGKKACKDEFDQE